MTPHIGILGLGFMGKQHYLTYARIPNAHVAAICDIDPRKRVGDWSGIGGNLGEAAEAVDLSGIAVYADADALFADPDIAVVDITLPTYLHAAYAIRAMDAGKHVICEKPMARTPEEAAAMLAAAERTGRRLFIAQCLRFWPPYVLLRDLLHAQRYGRVRSAVFARRSCLPTWSWDNWLLDPAKSGGCVLDLHIHDADFILHCFGRPDAVVSTGLTAAHGRNDHCVTVYEYADEALIVAEGGWGYPPTYPFSMTFTVDMEQATVRLDETGQLTLYPREGAPQRLAVAAEDGYYYELDHFLRCLAAGTTSPVVTPESAYQAVCLVTAEMASLHQHTRQPVLPVAVSGGAR